MMTPPPSDGQIDQFEDENGLARARRGFQWRARLERRAIGFAEKGPEGGPQHRGGRFAYQLRDEQRLKNVTGVPQAIVKVISGGGVGSRGELVAQLNYLSRDGAQELLLGGDSSGYEIDGQDAIRNVATDWAMAWEDAASRDGRTARAKSKSFHLLVSYPKGTDPDMAQMAAEEFTNQLCQSGEYGDYWRYIAAWHTDRAHPHMHVVIDRLGASGRMMQIHPAKTINPRSLRSLQVDTAAEYGIALNDTPRVSRGHRDRGLSSPEWRAEQRGERRDRSPTRQDYAHTASSFTDDAIGREANELKKLSDRYRNADTPKHRDEAKALERASFVLIDGGTLDDAPQMVAKEQPEPQVDEKQYEKANGMAEELGQENAAVVSDIAEPEGPDTQTNDPNNTNERYSANTAGRDFDETRSGESERRKPLTEQELSDILSRGVRKLNETEKRQQRDHPERETDRGLGFD